MAVLLGQLELQDLFNIMEDKSFRPQILPYALDVGTNQSLKVSYFVESILPEVLGTGFYEFFTLKKYEFLLT